jgi:two-component system nitrate/nitrite response regulator NarL
MARPGRAHHDPGMGPLHIVVADDHPVFREGMVRALRATGRYEIAGEAADGRSAFELIATWRPDAALIDLRMPELDGLGVLRRLRRAQIALPVVILSALADPVLVERALAAGAAGYVTKDAARAEIIDLLDRCLAGGAEGSTRALDQRPVLMDVEVRLLDLLHQGWAISELPAVVGLSRARIDRYLADATEKLATEDVEDAVASAVAWGLL